MKWFSQARGNGFITGEDGLDRYFSVRDVCGADLPSTGDAVEFTPSPAAKKGPRAETVEIVSRARKQPSPRNDRINCPHCAKEIVPRIITYQGEVERTVCPFCGGTVRDFSMPWGWLLLLAITLIVIVKALS